MTSLAPGEENVHPLSRSSRSNRSPRAMGMMKGSSAIYTGVSDRPMGWKKRPQMMDIGNEMGPRRVQASASSSIVRSASTRSPSARSPGANSGARSFSTGSPQSRNRGKWDFCKRDYDLWLEDGNCYVHLYGQGHTPRGPSRPSFRVPMNALLDAKCFPLLERFLSKGIAESPNLDGSYSESQTVDLYIPAPTDNPTQASMYHTSTRNFFAWIFGKPLVGTDLGSSLIGLLNSMVEFRSSEVDNFQSVVDYIEGCGYLDMSNCPEHALALLLFAENFHLKDLWIDSFAHCTGMIERLPYCLGFQSLSQETRSLIGRSHIEMDVRLDHCGSKLGNFLSDDLDDAHVGLPPGARNHMDRFRSFLESYHVQDLGYYPPLAEGRTTFPMDLYKHMLAEFQKLYEYLVDSSAPNDGSMDNSSQGGLCVLQIVKAFDKTNNFSTLQHPLPLLPKDNETPRRRMRISGFGSWKTDRDGADPRLVALAALHKATNCQDPSVWDCKLVRAYRGFEKECVFPASKDDKGENVSASDARKVRWILVYATLQFLLCATKVPDQVRHVQDAPYNLCVSTVGCPPWKDQAPYSSFIRSQTDQMLNGTVSMAKRTTTPFTEIQPDVDYLAVSRLLSDQVNSQTTPMSRNASVSSRISIGRGATNFSSLKRAMSRGKQSPLGKTLELQHPRPRRPSHCEIKVQGYGNGTIDVDPTEQACYNNSLPRFYGYGFRTILRSPTRQLSGHSSAASTTTRQRKSADSDTYSNENEEHSGWSEASWADSTETTASSVTAESIRRHSNESLDNSRLSVTDFLELPRKDLRVRRVPLRPSYENLAPEPLRLRKVPEIPVDSRGAKRLTLWTDGEKA